MPAISRSQHSPSQFFFIHSASTYVHRLRLAAVGGEGNLGLDAVGHVVEPERLVDRVVAVAANVVLGRVPGNEVRRLRAPQLQTRLVVFICRLVIRVRVCRVGGEHLLWDVQEPRVGAVRIQYLFRAVQNPQHFARNLVRQVGHVAEAADKWTDNVRAVARKRPLEDVEADAARVHDGEPRLVLALLVDHHVGKHLVLDPREDALVARVLGPVHPQVLGGASAQGFPGPRNHVAHTLAVRCDKVCLVPSRVVVHAVQVVVNVLSAEFERRLRRHVLGRLLLLDAINGHPPNSLHVAPRRHGKRLRVVAECIPHVRMAAKEDNGDVPVLLPQRREDCAELVHAQADVAGDDKEVRLLAHRLLEPLLLDGLRHGLHNRVVGVARKFKEEAKRDNLEALVLGLELAVALRQRLALAGRGVDVVEVGGNVVVLEVGDRRVALAVGRVGLVELVVADADNVDVLLG
ncbi:hypothetical protein TOPH_06206, partial [Tolypocladium ophioglossoides CBS 100239]